MSDDLQNTEESFDDIELAYREAMKSLDEAEQQVGSALMELADSSDEEPQNDLPFTSIGEELAEDLAALAEAPEPESVADGEVRVSPRAVIEAALFVGGEVALTARTLASLIGKDTSSKVAVRIIDELNESYAEENRPYEIRLKEGGFQIELLDRFADVQARVFGLGPREVRLSPEILEVLAFVAYNQPVSKADMETVEQAKALTHLRRLIRLRLVEVERNGKKRTDIIYRTSERFLELFGLTSIEELPQADIFNFK